MAKSDNPADSFLSSAVLATKNTSPKQEDSFWTHEEIDATRWSQAFPYQFILVKKERGDTYIQEFSNDSDKSSNWVFTLPIPPESMTVTMPFAISGSVTQEGYFEEHGGAPIRMIQLSGTTGVLPLRPTAATRRTADIGAAIFGGTIEQSNQVVTSARNLGGSITGENTNFYPNIVDEAIFSTPEDDPGNMVKSSGYYQFRLLQKFFENYAAFRKTEKGRDYRLAFCIWKDQSVYLVTPQQFTVTRSAESPFEYRYSISLKAWRRISLDSANARAFNEYAPAVRDPNSMASVLTSIQAARDILENARDVISAVGGDLDRALFEPLRQVSMFLKDALAVPLSFADLPIQVLNSCQDAIIQYVSTKQAFEGASDSFAWQSKRVADAFKAFADLAVNTSKVETAAGILVTPGRVDIEAAHPAMDVFRQAQDNYDLFKNIQPGQVNLPPATIRMIVREREAVRKLKRLDFEQMRDSVAQVAADFADAVGAGHATYTSTFRRSTPVSTKTPTQSDFKVMFALNRVRMELNRLAASGEIDQRLRSVDFVAGLARRSGMAFRTPKSKFAVPYPYGVTLEQLAARYLGNPDRWIEIAALNGLRSPYVDEVGFELPLLTNGNGNQVTVADSTNLFVGQLVRISASNTTRTKRRITKIEKLSSTMSVITLDGEDDLARFSTLAGATLHAFLPDTVNSQMMIYIPSDIEPSDQDYQTKDIPGLDVYDQLLEVGGVDLLLTPTNDLAITPDGDCRLAVGLTNIVQTARIRLSTPQGSLHRHPEFGLPISLGQSIADMNAKTLLKATKNLFLGDPTFTGVQSASVRVNGPVVSIAIGVGIRGHSQVVPITLDIKK